jgi:hypothetical protein
MLEPGNGYSVDPLTRNSLPAYTLGNKNDQEKVGMAGKIYKCLNPVGNQEPVDLSPLAPRLGTLAGKTIHLSLCGEQDIWAFLEKRLKADYPDTIWTVKKGYTPTPVELSDEEKKTTDGVILGVCW